MRCTVPLWASVWCLLFAAAMADLWDVDVEPACTSSVFCDERLLRPVQLARLYNDSKTFVDMPLIVDPQVALDALRALGPSPTPDQISIYLDTYFSEAGSDVDQWTPSDWVAHPVFVDNIVEEKYQDWALSLNEIWSDLGKQLTAEALTNPERHSFINFPNPFIAPGGRFREWYYWDTYWILKGLMTCGMLTTTRGMIENLASSVLEYGFVPNGGRVYYLDRSQPPLLPLMVNDYVKATGNISFFCDYAATALNKEHSFWTSRRTDSTTGLAYFRADTNRPRPEGYAQDYDTAQNVDITQRAELYRNLASGAETGWDFSSRWFADGQSIETIRVSQVIPVDLNSILYADEVVLSNLYLQCGDSVTALTFSEAATQRAQSVNALLWDQQRGSWYDYFMDTQERSTDFYPSNFLPLWAGLYEDQVDPMVAVQTLVDLDLTSFPGGIPSSFNKVASQQWDFPNSWPPSEWFIIEGLREIEDPLAQSLAKQLADIWVTSNYVGWDSTNHMYEKYNATQCGAPGGGGEYDVQEGFGWTNGVILDLLVKFYSG
ncbi:trehalase precursor [Pelomyxa schiedti]|nr:trehalase precursor [Pelomyxa schiedti]